MVPHLLSGKLGRTLELRRRFYRGGVSGHHAIIIPLSASRSYSTLGSVRGKCKGKFQPCWKVYTYPLLTQYQSTENVQNNAMSPNCQNFHKKNRTKTDPFLFDSLHYCCIYPANSNLSDNPDWITWQLIAFLFLDESLCSHRWSRVAHIAL